VGYVDLVASQHGNFVLLLGCGTIIFFIFFFSILTILQTYKMSNLIGVLYSITEITTPNVNQRYSVLCFSFFKLVRSKHSQKRWFFSEIGSKEGSLYFWNGVVMFIGFAFVRIPISAFALGKIIFYDIHDLLRLSSPLTTYLFYLCGTLILLINCKWTLLIFRGMMKAVKSKEK
jgi:hypothetical protein